MASKECNNFFLHLFFFFFLHSLCFTSLSFDSETDRLSLLSFKEKITEDPLEAMSSWNDSLSFCKWKGVTCSTRRPRVTTLSLPSQKLGGLLSPAIANLTFLRVIDLSGNNFKGQIPEDIGRLFRLQYIYLTENSFGGEIPANLSKCSDLRVINFNFNSLTGKIPIELGHLPKLIALHISANQLTGGIPPALGNISSLLNLSIAQNSLGGTIPYDIGRLANLQFLQFGSNNLSGLIPPPVFNLSRISILAVALNNLVGSFPVSLGINFPNLKQLLVGVNRFSGSIPPSLSNISSLQIIDLPDNRFSGMVPNDLGRILNLQRLNVGRNFLGGGAPDELEFINSLTNCSKFQMLGIDSNRFSGLLPQRIANLSINMNSLLIGDNRLCGSIPSGITNLVNLNTLNVSWNKFDGQIVPNIGKLFNLRRLYMNGNGFNGPIPFSIGNLTQLFELRLDVNKLESVIPSSLGNCRQLQLLNLSGNNLSDFIPLEVFTLSSVTVSFNLARNSLSGIIPVEVGNFLNLREFDLSDNQLSGGIPESLGRCSSIEHIYMQRNSLSGSISSSLSALKGIQDLDLSKNNFTGSVPKFLQDFVFLRYLNLSFNRFKGEVPKHGIFANRRGVLLDGNDELCGGSIELALPVCADSVGRGKFYYLKLVIGTVIGVLGFLAMFYVSIACVLKRSRRKSLITFPSSADWSSRYSYKELEKATNGFSPDNLVGTGSFSSVYKGVLSENGKLIAVKVLKNQENGVLSKIYMAECEALSNIKHRNLVKFLGGCTTLDSEGQDFKAIVLEFMPNGSLDKLLHGNEQNQVDNLNIVQRLRMAIDVASALEYLHYYSQVQVAHCDLKPGNVLIDNDMCAHLSDFGLAKFLKRSADACEVQAQTSSIGIRGSIGYVAPEYGIGGAASVLGDVYRFGILVLEMFTGKRPTDDIFRDGLSLHEYAKTALSYSVMDIVDPTLLHLKQEEESEEKLEQCLVLIIRTGVACSQGLPQERMNIKDANMNLQLIRDAFFN